jgi:hypothetical protein
VHIASPGHLVGATLWLGMGIVLFLSWREFYEGARRSHVRVAEVLGVPFRPKRLYRALTRFVVTAVSVGCLFGAITEAEQAFTGRESRLRMTQTWRDMWPF